MEEPGDSRTLDDVALLGICDQLSDEQLRMLADVPDGATEPPVGVMKYLMPAAKNLLRRLFVTAAGREQVADIVGLEQDRRNGGIS